MRSDFIEVLFIILLNVLGWFIPGISGGPTWTPPPFIICGRVQVFFDFLLHLIIFSFAVFSRCFLTFQLLPFCSCPQLHVHAFRTRNVWQCGVLSLFRGMVPHIYLIFLQGEEISTDTRCAGCQQRCQETALSALDWRQFSKRLPCLTPSYWVIV